MTIDHSLFTFLSYISRNINKMNKFYDAGTPEDAVFGDPYFVEVQKDIWTTGKKKTMNSIFIIGGILLFSDLIGLSMAHSLNGSALIYVLIVPLIYAGLGFFARTQPMIAVVIAIFIFIGILLMNLYLMGPRSILSGLIIKAVVVFFFISGFRHARDAETAKKNLATVNNQ